MRIKAIVEPFKYNEHKKFNDTSEYKTKQNNNNVKVSFYEILKQAKRDLNLQNNVRTENQHYNIRTNTCVGKNNT